MERGRREGEGGRGEQRNEQGRTQAMERGEGGGIAVRLSLSQLNKLKVNKAASLMHTQCAAISAMKNNTLFLSLSHTFPHYPSQTHIITHLQFLQGVADHGQLVWTQSESDSEVQDCQP